MMQADTGVSLENQAQRIKSWCDYKNHILLRVYEDAGISGSTIKKREGFKQLMLDLSKGDILCVADLSRLARDSTDAMTILRDIRDRGATLVSLNPDIDFSTPTGELMYTILAGFNQLERKQIADRVKTNLKTLSEQNKLRGKPPFGFKFDGKDKALAPCPSQQALIPRIIVEYRHHKSCAKVAQVLNDEGLNSVLSDNKQNVKPQKFFPSTIQRILADQGIIEMKDRKLLSERYMGSRVADMRKEDK